MNRLFLAIRCFFCVLFGKPLPVEVKVANAATTTNAPTPVVKTEPGDARSRGAAQLLALLQREGRFIDFLQESIDGYDDAQIGAAVRNIHRDCRDAITKHCKLEPILAGEEDSQVNVDAGFDPSQIRLIGKVAGQPPFHGKLRHQGWRLTETDLPLQPMVGNVLVVAPAEVELA